MRNLLVCASIGLLPTSAIAERSFDRYPKVGNEFVLYNCMQLCNPTDVKMFKPGFCYVNDYNVSMCESDKKDVLHISAVCICGET